MGRGAARGEGSLPGLESGNGDDLIKAIIARGGYDQAWLTEDELAANPLRVDAGDYARWFDQLDDGLRAEVTKAWGPAPGEMYLDRSRATSRTDPGDLVYAGLQAGNVVVLVQPPRGFGENPIAIYHDPDLAPSHHYLAAYRWLEAPTDEGGFGAHAIVHVGKHGNLEWLPGKGAALSAGCAPDAALGNLPLVYPFLVNDPGEGTQAKRRAHAVLVDHLVPPMTRADSYGDIARLEQLLDEYAMVSVMDPAKAPAVRQQIWTLIQAARLDHDLGLTEVPTEDSFDEFVLHVDGWLCEIKDVQIRGGLHVLGQAPQGRHASRSCWPSWRPSRSGVVCASYPVCARRWVWTRPPRCAPTPTPPRPLRESWWRPWRLATGTPTRWTRSQPSPRLVTSTRSARC
ncbi:hypothetical protein GCM10025862_14020 [Arsenicicoccus piscis]|uniref:CobN/magnesium chelatase domain-containing protein n=1 Tax=Arsenicicoccus piscis TaxID=673954 RepID=A0ABQ6HLZ0_9MICO|nr:hypothetical protein GCM10025862_14020 [Arsenicicoccus piscis]